MSDMDKLLDNLVSSMAEIVEIISVDKRFTDEQFEAVDSAYQDICNFAESVRKKFSSSDEDKVKPTAKPTLNKNLN